VEQHAGPEEDPRPFRNPLDPRFGGGREGARQRVYRAFDVLSGSPRRGQSCEWKENRGARVSCSCIFDVLACDADATIAGKLGTYKKRKFLKILIMEVAVDAKEAQTREKTIFSSGVLKAYTGLIFVLAF